MPVRGMRSAVCATALATALMTGGCGADDRSAPATADASPTPAAEAEATAVLESFWKERVRVETSGAYDTADFSKILAPELLEPQTQQYRQLDETGFRRVGEPQLRDYTAEVDGETAVASVCVQEDEWGATADIEIETPEPQGWYASSHRLERTGGTWLIVATAEPPAGVSC